MEEKCVFRPGDKPPRPGDKCYNHWRLYRLVEETVTETLPIDYYTGYTVTAEVDNDGSTTIVKLKIYVVPGGEEVVYV